jgi:outer membrane murein-binding lipoprotein Lpp
MRYGTQRRIAALTVPAVLLLAGCGSGSKHAAVQVGQVNTPTTATTAVQHGSRHVHHRHVQAPRKTHHAPKPLIAHGGTAKFLPTATGRPKAIKALAATIPGGVVVSSSSGDSSKPSKPKETTRKTHFAKIGGPEAAFISSADAICTSYRATVHSIAGTATTLASQQAEMQNLVNATSAALKQLEGLSPPTDLASLAGQYVSDVGQSVSNFVLAQQRSSSLSELVGTQSETQDMNYSQDSGQEALNAQSVAQKVGFKVCGSSGAEWL